jgi:hypothetical protein
MSTDVKIAALLAACPPSIRESNPDCPMWGSGATIHRIAWQLQRDFAFSPSRVRVLVAFNPSRMRARTAPITAAHTGTID